jgi:hypothetical protein
VAQTTRTSTGISPRPAQSFDHALLQKAQQLGLQRHRQVADLVEEQGAFAGVFDLADGLLGGAGERALLVAEQFGFQQGVGDGGAVDGDEALVGARRQFVDAARQHFLAGAGLAQQQHGGVGRGDFFHGAADLQHGFAAGQQALQRGMALACGQLAVFGFERLDVQGALDHQFEDVGLERLLEEIVGAEADRLDRVAAVEVAGDDDDLGQRRQREDLLQRGEALGGAVGVGRQAEVEQHHRRFVAAQLGDRVVAVGGDDDLVVVEAPFELLLQPEVVFHQQDLLLGFAHAAISLFDA